MWGRNATMLMGVSALSNGTAYMIDPGDFFLVRSSGGAYSYQKATTGLAADDAGVYWLEGGNLVKQFPIASFGSGTPGILSSGITTAEGIVAYGSFVYFTTVDTVYRVPNTPGTAATPLVTGQVNVGGIAADASGVYWTNRAGGSAGLGSVMRAPLTGGSAVPLASGQNDPHGIALDATTVYWTNSAGGQVMKVAK